MLRTITLLGLLLLSTVLYSQDLLEEIVEKERSQFRKTEVRMLSVSTSNYDVKYYRCHWELDPSVRYISGSVTSHFTMLGTSSEIAYDLASALTVDSVVYHGNKIAFGRFAPDGLRITFPANIAGGTLDSVSVFYRGIPPNTGFGSFNQALHSGTPVLWSLSEPYGARDWWPCKDMLKDKADSIDIIITNPAPYRSSSNGLPVNQISTATHNITHWKHRYPIATYLVAFAVTNYDVTNDGAQSGSRLIPLALYSYPENTPVFMSALTTTKIAMPVFSNHYGEYPFSNERYAQTQFSWGGGMEHQTNTFLSSAGTQLVSHELGHQWFGDKVTTGSWADLWLNEGFATYSEFIYTENTTPALRITTLTGWRNSITSQPGGSVYIIDTNNVNRLFSGRLTYQKGGYVVHMLRWKLGDSAFFRGLRRYLNDPALQYKTARTADLQRNLEQESGVPLTEFLEDWIYGEGYPDYSATWRNSATKKVKVTLSQTTSHASVDFYEMPVPLQFKNATRDTILVVNHTLNGQVFEVDPGFVPDTMIIDPQLWILSKIKTTQKLPDETATTVSLGPNPARNGFTIQLPTVQPQKMVVGIYNSIGQMVRSMSIPENTTTVPVSTRHMAAGIYWIRITGSAGFDEKKQVIILR
jgi:aminopeptidase N